MCGVEFYGVFIVLFTRVVAFPSKSSFAYSFVVKVILAFLFHTSFVPVVIDPTGSFHELSESGNLSPVSDKLVFHEVFESLLIVIYKGLFPLSRPSRVSLEVLSIGGY